MPDDQAVTALDLDKLEAIAREAGHGEIMLIPPHEVLALIAAARSREVTTRYNPSYAELREKCERLEKAVKDIEQSLGATPVTSRHSSPPPHSP